MEQTNKPPDPFCEQVKGVLEHLQDFPYLNLHELSMSLPARRARANETRGQRLRRVVLEAIEELNPGEEVFFRSFQARFYSLLKMHYVESLTMQDLAQELGISERQAFRDLRRAEEAVASILWDWIHPAAVNEAHGSPASSPDQLVQEEMQRIEPRFSMIDLRSLLLIARKAVDRLAFEQKVELDVRLPDEAEGQYTDPDVAQQVLISVISYAVQQSEPGRIILSLKHDNRATVIELHYTPGPAARREPISPVTRQLVERLGWEMIEGERPDGRGRTLELLVDRLGTILLVVDNNEALAELLSRYLNGENCQVVGASSGLEGLSLAQTINPDAVILDVMMPDMDGWEVLQRLRTGPQTRHLPVIICSIFDDPRLALSLGAEHFLPKPVVRGQFLEIMRKLKVI